MRRRPTVSLALAGAALSGGLGYGKSAAIPEPVCAMLPAAGAVAVLARPTRSSAR